MGRLDIVSEDDDKGGKRRRRKESQARAALIIIAAISFLFLVVMVKMNHSKRNKYVPSRIRRANAAAATSQDGQHNLKVVHDSALLPLSSDSLYNQLLIPDLLGNYVSMDKYRGMVTLIVNVACL